MSRALPLLIALLLGAIAVDAVAAAPKQQQPSVLVQLTKLHKGSLPRIVTAYGTVQPSPAARQTVMAPVSAVVGAVYVRQGESVAAGAPLIRLVPSPATAASYAQAEAALRLATELTARTRSLVAQHLATGQQLAGAKKSEADARSVLAALKAEGADAAQTVRAPSRAIVTAVSTSNGAMVGQGAPLIDLARPGGLVLRVAVVPAQALSIRPGDAATITPLGRHDPAAGRVVLVASMVDPQTGLVPVGIALPPGRFLAGETATAAIVTGRVQGYVVPHDAVLLNDKGAPYVVQAANGVARKVPVRVLISEGGKDVVEGPLDPAAPVVLAGNYQLDNGMRVRVADPSGARAQ